MFIALTGRPGVGKSTVFFKVINVLRSYNVNVIGFYCPEIREHGKRIGFKIVDLSTNAEGWLALTPEKATELGYGLSGRKRIGRYVVISEEAIKIGIKALRHDVPEPKILAIDEIGPMELSIPQLRMEIIAALKRYAYALLVVHRNLNDREILNVLNSKNAELIIVSEANRNILPNNISMKLLSSLGLKQ